MAAEPTTTDTTPAPSVAPHLIRAGVPARFMDRSFGSFEPRAGTRKAFDAAVTVADADDRGLVLVGPPGSGKTHLAVAVVRRRLERWLELYPVEYDHRTQDGHDVVFVRPPHGIRFEVVPSLLDRIRMAIGNDDHSDPLAPLRAANLLVLDDLGREKSTDWVAERLYVLVNDRYNALLPTIVTTNYMPDQLAERGYDALFSRLREGNDVVKLTATDRREVP